MLNSIFTATTAAAGTFSLADFLLCTLTSLALGLCVAGIYMYRNSYSKSFVITLALLPAMVQLVISLVNGNLGAGVAVMGAFSLVRFRSIPGSAREISSIFLAMAIGLGTGMGYLTAAALFLLLVGLMTVILTATRFGEPSRAVRELKITIPEDLDYTDIFDDLFATYTNQAELVRVKTTNLGSLYQLQYHVVLKSPGSEKELIDQIRCRNGNLNIVSGRVSTAKEEL